MSAPPSSGRRAWLPFAGKGAVSLLLLGILVWRVDLGRLLRTLGALPLPVFAAAFLAYLLGYILSTIRWQRLLLAEGVRLSFVRLVLVYFQGAFFNLFLPSLIGGDIFRGYAIYKITSGHDAALASILVDRLSGFAALMGIAVVALGLAYRDVQDPLVAGMILGVAGVFAVVILVLQNRRLAGLAGRALAALRLGRHQAKLEGMVQSLQRYRGHRQALAQALLLSTLLQGLIIVTYWGIGEALAVGVPIGYFFLYVPLITVLAMLPVSVAGLGMREGGAVFFFAKVGVDAATALGMALIWFSLTVLVSSLGGLALLLDLHLRKRTAE
ncbi:MAG: YbhN family protein [Candidatus Methylomirabilales bacterium]